MQTAGPTIVLLPGWARSAEDLQPMADELTTTFRVEMVSPDVLLSQSVHADCCSPYAAALVDRLSTSDGGSLLVGWSMGGMIALEAALAASHQVCGLMMIGSTARLAAADGYACGVPQEVLRAMQMSLSADPITALSEFLKAVYAPHSQANSAIEEEAKQGASIGMPTLSHGLEYLGTTDLRDRLPDLSCPLALLHGVQDRIIPVESSRFMHANVHGSRLVDYPDAGHALPLTHKRDVAAEIHAFATRVSRR